MKNYTERMDELRNDSGEVTYSDPLTSFFYQLLRDHLPAGTVEQIVCQIIEESGMEVTFTNGWLAKYANNLADKLRNASTVKLKGDLSKIWEEREKTQPEKPAIKESIKQEIMDDDLVAVKTLIDDKGEENIPDEFVLNSLKESKAALEMMLANGQLSPEEAERVKEEIGDLLGDMNEEKVVHTSGGEVPGEVSVVTNVNDNVSVKGIDWIKDISKDGYGA